MRARLRTRAPIYVMAFVAVVVTALSLAWRTFGIPIVINPTVSEPQGFYRIVAHTAQDYRRGMMVVFPVPGPFRSLVYGRGWLKAGVPLMKNIGALAGDQVCVREDHFEVNGKTQGPVSNVDRTGAALPRLRGCFLIGAGDFFPMSRNHERSFDGRYMGAQPLSAITGEARPLWTF